MSDKVTQLKSGDEAGLMEMIKEHDVKYVDFRFTDPRGKLLLFVAGAMQLMGLAMIRYIINIKV